MKLNGLDIEIIRGETASVTFLITDSYGRPFVLLNTDMFDNLNVSFKVKSNSQTIVSPYVIDKVLNINNFKRFYDETILNIQEEIGIEGGIYDPLTWSGCQFNDEDSDIKNQLYYHPGLKEYRFYWVNGVGQETNGWTDYKVELVVTFDPVDTKDLPYGNYFYDLVLEASNGDAVEYENVLINQHRFSVVYRV